MTDDTMTMIAALVAGDRWLNADASALHLGLIDPKGKPNRRRFLERVACLPGFPKPNPVTRSWRKSELDEWAEEQQRISRVA